MCACAHTEIPHVQDVRIRAYLNHALHLPLTAQVDPEVKLISKKIRVQLVDAGSAL